MRFLKINYFKIFPVVIAVSALCIVYTIITMLWSKGFKTGTDFSGGVELMVTFPEAISSSELNKVFSENNYQCEIQPVLDNDRRFYLRQTIGLKEDGTPEDGVQIVNNLKSFITAQFGENATNWEKSRVVSGVISDENKSSAVKVLIAALIGMVLYITFRFKFHYALAAIVAIAHDILIMLGAILITGTEVTVLTVTAVLTIVGYSVNDTIILFDRVRENLKDHAVYDVKNILNTAISQVLSRTLITSLTTMTVVLALFIFSIGALHDFAFALIVGLVSGTYSSIYIAGGYMLVFKKLKT